MKTGGIIVFGLNGCGKTTLGKALAEALHFKAMDVEDYYFLPAATPYSRSRTREEIIPLMISDMEKHPRFVLSAVNGDFGPEITSRYILGVWLEVPPAIRAQRIQDRSYAKFGSRVLPGGDMYEQEQHFAEFALNRSLEPISRFAEALSCPILRLDGTRPVSENVSLIVSRFTE